jgi:5-methylcytosine-specific restriction endonuclease McrA
MRDYISIESSTWADGEGVVHRVSRMKKLHFTRLPSHARLRAFVYQRDSFTCQWCGVAGISIPSYSGMENVKTVLKSKQGWDIWLVIDHIVSRRNGGSNHPTNLQTLCDPCNSAKSGLVDSKAVK